MGFLFCIDGIDGSTKNTQAELLAETLSNSGIKMCQISFPRYDKPSSGPVKQYLAGELGDLEPKEASMLYAFDRMRSWDIEDWRQVYEDDGIVISDRYTSANMIHQAGNLPEGELDEYLEWISHMEYDMCGIPQPDVVVYMDMPPKYALELIENRDNKATGESEKDILEKDRDHLQRAYDAGMRVAKKRGWKIVHCIRDGKVRGKHDIQSEIFGIYLQAYQTKIRCDKKRTSNTSSNPIIQICNKFKTVGGNITKESLRVLIDSEMIFYDKIAFYKHTQDQTFKVITKIIEELSEIGDKTNLSIEIILGPDLANRTGIPATQIFDDMEELNDTLFIVVSDNVIQLRIAKVTFSNGPINMCSS